MKWETGFTRRMMANCWQCGSRLRAGQRICMRCGATRRPEPTGLTGKYQAARPSGYYRQPTSTPPDYGSRAPQGHTGYTAPPAAGQDTWPQNHGWRVVDGGAERRGPYGPGPAYPVQQTPYFSDIPVAPDERDDDALYGGGPLRAQRTRQLHSRWYAIFMPAVIAIQNFFYELMFGLLGAVIGGGIWYTAALYIHIPVGILSVPMGYLVGRGVAMGSTYRGAVPSLLALALTVLTWAVVAQFLRTEGYTIAPLDLGLGTISVIVALLPTFGLPSLEE